MTARRARAVLAVMIGLSLVCLVSPMLIAMPLNTFWIGFWLGVPVTAVALLALRRRPDPWLAAAAAYPLVPVAVLVALFLTSGE